MNHTVKNILLSIVKDENGVLSSKRILGMIAGLSLIIYMFIHPSEEANNSVLILSLGLFGVTAIDKYISTSKIKEDEKPEEPLDEPVNETK